VYLNGSILGLSKHEIDARFDEIVDFAELSQFIDMQVRNYSSGMFVRLGFSVAVSLDPDILLVDEVLAVGDEAFQRKCLRHILGRIEQGTTVVLVSHAPGTIERACRRVAVLDAGRVVFDGPTADGLLFYHRMLGLEAADQAAARVARDAAVSLRVASLQDGSGRPRQVFETGERVRVVIELEALSGAPEAALVIDIRGSAGQSVFRTRHRLPAGAGSGELVFDVPSLALLGGDYDIALGVHEPGDAAPGIDRLLSFSVASADDVEGIADLRGSWTFIGEHVRAGR
jgi:ABC-2 type transport system ATP-binding protein